MVCIEKSQLSVRVPLRMTNPLSTIVTSSVKEIGIVFPFIFNANY
jgi:hypothetical protein